MRAAVSFIFLLWWISRAAALGQTAEDTVPQLFRAGQRALQDGQFTRAAQDFKQVLALEPTLIEAEVNLGLAYQGLLEYDSATRYLTKALAHRPELLGPNVIVGMDYLKLASPERAVPFLQRAVKLDPANMDALDALASAYLAQDDFRNAAGQFREIARLDPDKAEAAFKLGHQYLNLAASLAFRGAHLYHESPWGHRFLGDLMLQRGRWEDASKEYRKALSIDPQQPGLHASIGQAYLNAQKLNEAEAEFRQEENEPAWLGLASTQLAKGQPIDALDSLKKAWGISPEFLSVQREFPSIALSSESAKASLPVVRNEPESPAKHFLLARLFAGVNENAQWEREWKSFQNDFSAWRQESDTAQAPCQSHLYSRCIDSLKAQKTLRDPERLKLGKTYFTLQQYESAAEMLAQVHGAPVENAEASYWLERTYQAEGAETYTRLEETFPDSWRAHQLRAEGYALRGDLDDALKEFRAALELRPNSAELHEALGELYLDHHSKDSAESELEQSLTLDPTRAHALYLLGRVYVEDKENEKALPFLKRAVDLQPNLAEANSLLGTAYLRLGQYADAVPKLEKAAGSDQYGNVHFQLSVAYRKLGQPERAQKEMLLWKNLHQSNSAHEQILVMGSPPVDTEPQ